MAEQATEHMIVSAPPRAVLRRRSPTSSGTRSGRPTSKRSRSTSATTEGRPALVTFRAAAFGRSTSYTLAYDYAEAPRVLAWRLTKGDITTKLDGRYVFDPDGDGGTDITYHLEVELRVPIPGFIKMRAQSRIMSTALRELKARVESLGVTPKGDGPASRSASTSGGPRCWGGRRRRRRVLAEHKTPTPRGPADPASAAEVADTVVEVLATLADRVGADGPVGVGAPGQVDRNGVLRLAPNLRGADRADLRALVADRLGGAFVAVENDANCATLAELTSGAARRGEGRARGHARDGDRRGAGRRRPRRHGARGASPARSAIWWSIPPGRRARAGGGGAGSASPRAAVSGAWPARPPSAAGSRRWCASPVATPSVHGEHVTQAAAAGDPGALAVLDDLGWWVALGLANLTAILDPEVFVLGGGLSEAGDLLFAPVQRAFAELVEGGPDRPPPAVVPAELGERAGAIGAALAARAGGLSR